MGLRWHTPGCECCGDGSGCPSVPCSSTVYASGDLSAEFRNGTISSDSCAVTIGRTFIIGDTIPDFIAAGPNASSCFRSVSDPSIRLCESAYAYGRYYRIAQFGFTLTRYSPGVLKVSISFVLYWQSFDLDASWCSTFYAEKFFEAADCASLTSPIEFTFSASSFCPRQLQGNEAHPQLVKILWNLNT